MKRVLGLLLAVCMLCGAGAVGAGAKELEDFTLEELAEAFMIVGPISAWVYVFGSQANQDMDVEIAAGLRSSPGPNASSIQAQINAKEAQLNAYNFADTLDLIDACLNNSTVKTLVLDVIDLYDQLLPELYLPAFVTKYNIFKDAFLRSAAQEILLKIILDTKRESIANIVAIDAQWEALWVWYNDALWVGSEMKGDLAALTALQNTMEIKAKAILDAIVYKDDVPPMPEDEDKIYKFFASFFSEGIAKVFTWIVKFLFFGWLWGRWL